MTTYRRSAPPLPTARLRLPPSSGFRRGDLVQQSPGKSQHASPQLTHVPVSDWLHLKDGDRVVVQKRGDYAKTGRVDGATKDSCVFWVLLDQGQGRIIVDPSQQLNVWCYEEEP